MGFLKKAWNKLKGLVSGGGKSSDDDEKRKKRKQANKVTNYGGRSTTTVGSNYGTKRSSFSAQASEEERKRQERQQRLQNAFKARASTSASDSPSTIKATPPTPKGTASASDYKTAFKATKKSLANASQKATVDPKERLRQNARQKREAYKATYNKDAYNKATKDKYNVEKNGSEARRAQKSQAYDVNVEKYETKAHPIATSAGRGALSGVTFGGSELMAQTSKNRRKSGAEEFYQKNKSKGAETVGEIAGSLASFGLTEAGATKLASKVAPKFVKEGGASVAKSLAKNSAFRAAAKKEAERTGIEVTEEVIDRFARQRAQRLVNSIGSDMAVNLTTGGAMDVNQSLRDSMDENGNIDWSKFRKEMGTNAALNLGIGGAVTVLPAWRKTKGLVNLRARDDALDLARRITAENDNAVEKLVRGVRKTEADSALSPIKLTSKENLREQLGNIVRREDAPIASAGRREKDALSAPRIGESLDDTIARRAAQSTEMNAVDRQMPQMRQAMQDTFTRDADEARRIDMNEILARNSPFRQADEAVQATEPSIQNEAARIVNEDFANATQPRPSEADFPYEGTPEANEMLNRINEGKRRNAETYANEQQALEGRVRELENEPPRIEGEEPLRYNNVAEDTPIGGQTIGERMAKSAYERNTGETLEEGGLKTLWNDAWNASREYHASHATGRDVRASKTSVSQLNMMNSDAEREIRDKLFDEGWLDYTVVHTDEMLDKVSKEFRDDPKRWVDDMIDVNNGRKLDFRETPEWQARVHYIMAVVDPSADPASEIAYTEAYKLATQMSSKAGQTNNLRRQFVHLTPMGRRDAIMDEMAQILYNSQGFHNVHKDMPTDKYDALAYVKEFLEGDEEIEKRVQRLVEVGGLRRDAEYGLGTATESAAKNTSEGFASIGEDMPLGEAPKTSTSKSDSDEIMEAHAELIAALNEKNPKSKLDVVQEIRYLNMLGNPKTHIRNIFGSGFFSPIRQISNTFRSVIENSSYIKNTGVDITLHGGLSPKAFVEAHTSKPTSESGKKALEAYERLKPELLGSMKLDNQMYSGRAKTLAGKVLDKVSDFNSTLLSKEDDYFKQRAFRENYIKSYEAYQKRGVPITKKIEKRIEAEAMQEAQIATFNEYNEFAKFLSKITSKANDPNASGLAKAGGLAVNAVMPFTKVPANIMKQSINYSPLGLARGFSGVKSAVKKGDSEALNRAIDELASGLTGTGIFGMGMLLGKTTDWFTTNAGKDDAAAKFKKQQGIQNYSVMLKTPDGEKYSVTLDWLVPNSATFFAGVEMANQLKSGDFNALDLGGDWAQITSRIVEPVMETSMLSGLYSMLESTRNGYGDDDKQSALSIMLRETAQSYVNSLVPTMLGQAARTKYKNDKQITGETDWEYFRNQTKSKLGLAETNILGEELGADTTAKGDVKGQKETTGDYAKSALKNFLSPANIQKVDLDELDNAKIKEYEDAVKNGADPQEMAYLFPKKQYKKQFTTGDMDVKLSNKDLSAYNQAKTTGGSEAVRYALENIMFNRYEVGEDGKKQATADAYTTAQKQKVIKDFEGKSIQEVEKWVREQPEFKNANEAEQKKLINGLWSYSNQGKAQSAKRVGEQAVIKAQGGDVNEYNFNNEITEKKRAALQPFIDNGTISYEDAVDFARYAGKTYYYEDDEGGHSQTYYNKGAMLDYIKSKGYDDETAAALFNSFKASNAKEYGASGRRGYRRRGYRRWRRWGRHGSGKAKTPELRTDKEFKAKAPKAKTTSAPKVSIPTGTKISGSSTKVNVRKRTYKSMASAPTRASRSNTVNMRGLKLTPPEPKKTKKKGAS